MADIQQRFVTQGYINGYFFIEGANSKLKEYYVLGIIHTLMKEGKADGVNPNKYPDYQAVVDEVIEYYDSAKAYRDRPIVDVVRELVQ